MISNAFLEICSRVDLGAIYRLRTYGFHPGLTQFLTNYVMRFSSSQCPRRSAAGDAAQRAVHGPKGSPPREDSNPGHYASVMTIYTSVSPVHVHQSLRSCCREGFGFGLVFVLPMKIEIRLLIGRDFFADWLSSLSTFSRTEKSSLAASQPPRVSSTIKPRCDAAPVPHTPHTSTSIPAHARSSDLRQHQVSLVSINTRARFGARVAARPRDSGDRSGRCFSSPERPRLSGESPSAFDAFSPLDRRRGEYRRLDSVDDVPVDEVYRIRTRLYTRRSPLHRALRRARPGKIIEPPRLTHSLLSIFLPSSSQKQHQT